MKFQSASKTKAMFTYADTSGIGLMSLGFLIQRLSIAHKQDAVIRYLKANSFFNVVSPAPRYET